MNTQSASAEDRPYLFGMNPTPMEWWDLEADRWDPILFRKMSRAGCTVARIGMGWNNVEKERGVYNWERLDRWVNLCLDNNIEPLMLLGGTPEWAMPDYVDERVDHAYARYPPAEEYVDEFKRFFYDVVRRYRGKVRYYEFWNEANGYGWYTALLDPPSYSRADLYVPWMKRAYTAVKLADPTAMMSTTGIDDNGPDGHGINFLRLIYEEGGKGYFDAVADHPYSPQEFEAWKLEGIREVLKEHGDDHVEVWITEYGYPMNPESYDAYKVFMRNYFDTLSSEEFSYVTIATWHTANEFPWEEGYGLTEWNLEPKPPWETFVEYPKPARPVISNIKVNDVSPTTAVIEFETDIPSRSLIMYGRDNAYGQITGRLPEPVKSHKVKLIGLEPGAEYHFRIRTGAVKDGDSFSLNQTLKTPEGKAVRLVSGPEVTEIGRTSATITWTTDVPSDSAVQFGQNFHYSNQQSQYGSRTQHSITLRGLRPGENYQYRVVSRASGHGSAVVEGNAFTTSPE